MKLLMLLVVSACFAYTTSATSTPGLKYSYYEGNWNSLPNFNSIKPVKEGIVSNVNLDIRNRETQYAVLWKGYIRILTSGNYTFETLSDDGSEFYIGNSGTSITTLVNNNGLHAPVLRSGSIYLRVGLYPIAVSYFQKDGGQTMELYWSSNQGVPWQKIPDINFLTEPEGPRFTHKTLGLHYSYYEGTWSSLPNFNSIQAINKGIALNTKLDVRKRETKYAIQWLGYINIPDSGDYTFTTMSDDGSRMLIGDHAYNLKTIVVNDGLHASQTRSGTITLKAGIHPVAISYFQGEGDQTWKLFWSSNTGINREEIPDNAFIANLEGITFLNKEVYGLNYRYYEGSWNSLPDFKKITPVKEGIINNANLNPRNRETDYAFLWKGFIKIPVQGDYTFTTVSDDGSKFYIGDYSIDSLKPVVLNDGLHGNQSRSGTVQLSAGMYPVTISYFQKGGGQTMVLYWSSNTGITSQQIPDAAFISETGLVPRPIPTELLIPAEPENPVVTNPLEHGGLKGNINYYFSTSTGDDSRTSLQAQDSTTPWKTLNKLNAYFASLTPGDAVLLKRGEVFDGSITISKSGTSDQPIKVSAYGSGSKPVINGLSTLLNWNYVGNGVWESDFQTSGTVSMVLLNGVVQAMGRYPNFSDITKGYLKLESHSGLTSFTDNELTGFPNWTGAEAVIRKVDWVLDRCPITAHSGNRISYISPTGHQPHDGYGYFIQNHPNTLDERGEWYYDAARKKMKMYFGTTDNPNLLDVKASNTEMLVSMYDRSHLIFDNLAFVGANERAFDITYGTKIKIQNSSIDNTGADAIYVQHSPYLSIENNSINHSNNSGIRLYHGTSNALVKNNTIKNSGILHGMGKSNNQQMDGIYVDCGPSNIIEYNRIDSSGYCGITFTGDSTIVRNNFINYFCLTVNDGGGIYTWGGWDKVARKITNNIVLHGIGAPRGTDNDVAGGAVGIYTDDRSSSIEITGNTVAHCSRSGVFLHNSHEITLKSNTLFDNETQLTMGHDDLEVADPIRNIIADQKNTFFSKKAEQLVILGGSRTDDFEHFGSFNNNNYVRPLDKNGIISLNFTSESGYSQYAFYDLKGWQNKYRYDLNSNESPVNIPMFKVSRLIGNNKFSNGKFNTNINGAYCLSAPGKCTASWVSDGKIDGGAMQVSFDAPGTELNNVGTYVHIGPTQAGKTYVIRFSLLSPNVGKTLKGFMIDGTNYARLSTTKYFELTNTRKNHEFLYTATLSSSNVILAFEISGQDLPLVMDNFEAYEAEVVITNPDDYIRFEYNATPSSKTITLDGDYVDVNNRLSPKEVTLQPFSSVILIKQPVTQPLPSIADQQIAVEIKAPESRSVKISPNPAGSSIQISLRGFEQHQRTTLSLYSVSGIKLKTVPVTLTNQPLSVDVSSLTRGIYYIQLNVDGTIINEKFIKL